MVWNNTETRMNKENNLFTKEVGDELSSDLSFAERMMLMSTYEEFMIIIAIAGLIISILNMKNKK